MLFWSVTLWIFQTFAGAELLPVSLYFYNKYKWTSFKMQYSEMFNKRLCLWYLSSTNEKQVSLSASLGSWRLIASGFLSLTCWYFIRKGNLCIWGWQKEEGQAIWVVIYSVKSQMADRLSPCVLSPRFALCSFSDYISLPVWVRMCVSVCVCVCSFVCTCTQSGTSYLW